MTAPQAAFNVRGRGRHYNHPTLGQVPSITNIIGVLDKPALPRWAAKMTAQAAWTMRDSLEAMGETEAVDVLKGAPWRGSRRAAGRGTDIHAYLEAAAKGEPLPELEGEAVQYRKAADRFLADIQPEFVETEFTVFGDGYAGTGDFAAFLGRRLFIGDYKTSKAIYPEVALQLAALRHATHMLGSDGQVRAALDPDGAVAVRIGTDGHYELVDVDAGDAAYEAFLGCLEAWRWKHDAQPLRKWGEA